MTDHRHALVSIADPVLPRIQCNCCVDGLNVVFHYVKDVCKEPEIVLVEFNRSVRKDKQIGKALLDTRSWRRALTNDPTVREIGRN